MNSKVRRKFRKIFEKKTSLKKSNIFLFIFIISLAVFCSTQLFINSKLSPLGKQLQSLNNEKDLLLQENRELEKDLANSQSITVVEQMTNKKFKLTQTKTNQLIYVTPSVSAQAQ